MARAKIRAGVETIHEKLTESVLDRLRVLLSASDLSESALSEAIGRNRGWLGNHLRSGTVPNIVDLIMIADVAGFDVADVIPKRDEADGETDVFSRGAQKVLAHRSFSRPDAHDVFLWHFENKGVLQNHEWFEEFYELFGMPDLEALTVNPVYLGPKSAAAMLAQIDTLDAIRKIYEHMDEVDLREVLTDHAHVITSQKSSLTPRVLQYQITSGHEATLSYLRMLLPVQTQDGDRLVMNYSVTTELRETFKRTTEPAHQDPEDAVPVFRFT